MPVRSPAVAGSFYPSDRDELLRLLENSFTHPLGPGRRPPASEDFGKPLALISPHAGYVYSGPVAAHGYYASSSIGVQPLFLVVGPNHWGIGSGVAVFPEGKWATPLGEVEVDAIAAKRLVRASGIVDFDEVAHRNEHSIEVQVPFLQYTFPPGFRILAISMALQDAETAKDVGEALAEVIQERPALLVASSDLTHYEPHETAAKKDAALIKAIEALDVARYYSVLERLNVSACGYGPMATVMTAAKRLGATQARLLKYATSGETGGDYNAVVGYASVLIV